MYHLSCANAMGIFACLLIPITVVADEVSFNRDVRPILSNHCFKCHGPDAATREAGLRLDDRDAALAKAESGKHAIVAGDAAASELLRRVLSTDLDERMPPAHGPNPLDARQIQILRTWINAGANYEVHWAFAPVAAPTVPQAENSQWPINEIDNFVLAQLRQNQRHPAPPATRETLIRRVAFDLTGLPPTLEEIDQFLQDTSQRAYANMVDRYLSSSAYGEHMARHWLDLARYADTNGYQYDTEREQWVWRDWVIDAYNRNQPFDRFTIEQLAGDLLPEATPQQRLATGFNRNHGITIEGGIIDEEYRTEYVMDRLVTTGEVWLGLTVGCARCHDHKYDPLSQKEFYQLFAFFNQVPEKGMRGFAPQERIASPLASTQREKLKSEIAELQSRLKQTTHIEQEFHHWVEQLANSSQTGWQVVAPLKATSTGGSSLTKLPDGSLLAGGTNPHQDTYTIVVRTQLKDLTAVRLEALTDPALPGGGPGRYSNSNFVLSEFEVTCTSLEDPQQTQTVKFKRALADYSQANYEVGKAIDGTVANNNGWAVDGPTRKQPATAIFVADKTFGFPGGTELHIRLRHESQYGRHAVGRPRLAITNDEPQKLTLHGVPAKLLALANKTKTQRTPKETTALRNYFLEHLHPHKPLQQRIQKLEQQLSAAFPATMIMRDLEKPRKTHVLERGQYNQPTEEVVANVPKIFPALPAEAPTNRLAFARWLVDPRHPLTARVAVNRYWQRMFGVGLVKTSEDFGLQGELPSHPALLDWLAKEFIRSGWDIKHMQRLLVNSATYRQSSHVGAEAYRSDPENRWLARGPRLRLDAEEIRDSALAISGLLVPRIGGKSVYPYQPTGLWLELNNRPGYSKAYPRGQADDLYRRSMYTFWKRTVPSPMLKTLDAPEREFCTIRRSRTNTPLQALLLLNAPQFVEASRKLGERMMEREETIDQRITWAFRLVTARAPTADELQVLRAEYESSKQRYTDNPQAAIRLLKVGEAPFTAPDHLADFAACADVARLLLNLNEAITKG